MSLLTRYSINPLILEGKGEWNTTTFTCFESPKYSILFLEAQGFLEIFAYSKIQPIKFLRFSDCIEKLDYDHFLKLLLEKKIVCKEWYWKGQNYKTEFYCDETKIFNKRLKPNIDFKQILNIKISSILEMGFIVTSSNSYKEFLLF